MRKTIGIILACLIIAALDIIAGILGFNAEAAQNQKKHLRVWMFECKEPSHPAFVLSLAAAGLLVIAHVFVNLLGGFYLCTKKASSRKLLPMVCLVITWIILLIGLSLLGIGINSNHKSRKSCGITHRHLLYYGGIACMAHAIFSVAYYVLLLCT